MDIQQSKTSRIAKQILVYLGSAWLLVEVSNFIIERYNLDPVLTDIIILIVLFGLPATIIFTSFKGLFNVKAIVLQVLNIIGASMLVLYFLSHPLSMNPGKLRVLKLYNDKSNDLSSLTSIMVLPFFNYLGDESQEYLLAGMHDGLITEMGKLNNIRTISKTSSLPYKNTNKPLNEIANEIDVDAIVETSLTRVDSMVELNVKLYSAYPKEIMLWDHSYSVFKNELPNLYREVTKNVATKIGEALLPETEKHLAPKRIPKPGAYEAYLKGMYYTGFLNQEGFDLARKQFNKSIEIDSLFGQAYQGLATLIASQKQMGFIPSLPYQPLLDSLTDLSYLLDSTNAEVLMGVAAHNTWGVFNKWKKAEKYYRKSIEYNPNMTMTRITYAHFLMIQNRWDEAWNQMNYALELDPENPWVLAFSAAMFATEGKVLSAAKKAEKLIRIAPKHPMAEGMLLNKHIALKQESEAVKQLIKLVSIHGAPKTADIAMEGFAHGGFQGALEELLPYLESYSKDHFIRSWLMFNLYGYIGKKEKQEDWIIRMYENQDPNLPYLGIKKIKLDSEVRTMVMKEIGLW